MRSHKHNCGFVCHIRKFLTQTHTLSHLNAHPRAVAAAATASPAAATPACIFCEKDGVYNPVHTGKLFFQHRRDATGSTLYVCTHNSQHQFDKCQHCGEWRRWSWVKRRAKDNVKTMSSCQWVGECQCDEMSVRCNHCFVAWFKLSQGKKKREKRNDHHKNCPFKKNLVEGTLALPRLNASKSISFPCTEVA